MFSRLILKLRAYRKLSVLSGALLLMFLVFLSRGASHTLFVDILSDIPPEIVETLVNTPTETVAQETPAPVPTDTIIAEAPIAPEADPAADVIPNETIIPPSDTSAVAPEVSTPVDTNVPIETPPCTETIMSDTPIAIPDVSTIDEPIILPSDPVTPTENPVPTETTTNAITPPVDTPVETTTPTPADTAPVATEAVPVPAITTPVTPPEANITPTCAPKQADVSALEPVKEASVEEPVIKKVEQNIPFVDLEIPKATIEKEIIIDSAAAQSCDAESFHVEIQRGHSQVIPLLLQGTGSIDNSVKIGDVPKGAILTFVANGLKEITGISFDNLMISADIAPDAQTGSFNVPIIYSITSKNEVSNAMCQLNLVIQ